MSVTIEPTYSWPDEDGPWPESCWVKNRELMGELNRWYADLLDEFPVNYAALFSVGHIEPPTIWQRIKYWPRRQWWDLKDWIRHWVEDWE